MRGKTIKLFLMDGTPGGVTVAELMNWTGKVFVVPRTSLAQMKARPELQRSGAYLLVGDDPEVLGRLRVYVGEGENLMARVPQHDKDEDKAFYDRAVFITGKDDFLTKSHARWLERRLIALVKDNGSVSLANGTVGSLAVALSESDESDMDGFMDQVQLVLPALGFTFVQPRPSIRALTTKMGSVVLWGDSSQAPPPDDEVDGEAASGELREGPGVSPTFELKIGRASGRAREIAGQFFLLAGSTCRTPGLPSWTSYRALRDRLVTEGKIVNGPDPELLRVPDHLPLDSPSAGAAIVAGINMNGRQAWKTADGRTYQDWVDGQAATAVFKLCAPPPGDPSPVRDGW